VIARLTAFVFCLCVNFAAGNEELRQNIDAAITNGVDFLVSHQNPDGSWGGPTKTKGLNIYAPVPGAHHAYRAGASGLALCGLLDCGDSRDATKAAIAKSAAWAEASLPQLRRADQTTTYNVWGHAYGLRAINRLYLRETDDARKAIWQKLGQQQVDLLVRYADVNGGWGYLDLNDRLTTQKPSGSPTSFTTATALLAMHEAKVTMQLQLDDAFMQRTLGAMKMQRTPDFSYVYSFEHIKKPRLPINRPAGSLSRSQACNAASRVLGDSAITDAVIETWAKRFIDREGFLDMTRKRPVPHEGPFQIAGYFYYYGMYYFTESVRLLPLEKQKPYA
jgi:hypothetical protein